LEVEDFCHSLLGKNDDRRRRTLAFFIDQGWL